MNITELEYMFGVMPAETVIDVLEDKVGRRNLSRRLNISEHAARQLMAFIRDLDDDTIDEVYAELDLIRDVNTPDPALEAEVQEDEPEPKYSWVMGHNFLQITETNGTEVYNATQTSPGFKEARQLLLEGDIEGAIAKINIKKAITQFSLGSVKIDGEHVFYKDLEIDLGITQRIIKAMNEGDDFEYLVKFFEKLMANPSYRAVRELYGFLAHSDIKIDEDGDFIAYKRVNADYTDMYTGKMDNSPGKRVEVPRNMVDEDPNRTCSNGLHVAALSYIPHYGGGRGRILACKVNPMDVVAVPVDYNNAKLRCSGYTVIRDMTEILSEFY